MRMKSAVFGCVVCVAASTSISHSAYAFDRAYSPLPSAMLASNEVYTPVKHKDYLQLASAENAVSAPVESSPILGKSTTVIIGNDAGQQGQASISQPVVTQPVASQPITAPTVSTAPAASTSVTAEPAIAAPRADVSKPVESASAVPVSPSMAQPDESKTAPAPVPVTTQTVSHEAAPAKATPSANMANSAKSAAKFKFPKGGVAVPGAFITRPSIAMVSPLGVHMKSSPAGFSMQQKQKQQPASKGKNTVIQSTSAPVTSPSTVIKSAVQPAGTTQIIKSDNASAAANTSKIVGSSTIEGQGPEASTVNESQTIEQKQFNIEDYLTKTAEWKYASRYHNGKIQKDTYCPLIAVSLGYSGTINLGSSKYFSPAVSDGTNFYSFQDHTPTQTQTLYGFYAGYEWVLYDALSIQAGLGYYQSGSFNVKGLLSQGTSPASAVIYPYNYHVSSQRLLIETKFLLNSERAHPYVMLGLGGALNDSSGYNVGSNGATTYQFGNHTSGSITYSLGLGVDVDLASNIRLGFGYRFSDYGRYKLGHGDIGSTVTTNDLGNMHLYVHEFLTQFSLFF